MNKCARYDLLLDRTFVSFEQEMGNENTFLRVERAGSDSGVKVKEGRGGALFEQCPGFKLPPKCQHTCAHTLSLLHPINSLSWLDRSISSYAFFFTLL